ncbi:hypothetical protein VTJ04DRAFT_2901 [Mycothermus thermophilus]|uniref:uncharacterized protein n=1 Tax=Humicola insolens TaxID=85995 RepID=UPI003741F566
METTNPSIPNPSSNNYPNPNTAATPPPPSSFPSSPHHRRARWLVVLGSFLLTVPTYGLLSAIGGLDGCGWGRSFISSQWFPSQRGGGLGLGLATGLISLGAPLGGIFFSLVLQALFSRFGADWMSAGLVLPAVLAGFVVPACALVRTNPAGLTTTTTTTGGTGPASDQHADPEQLAGIRDAEASELVHTRGQDILFVLKLIEFWLPTYALLCKLTDSVISPNLVYELVLIIQWGSIPLYAVTVGAGDEQFT